MLAVGGAFVALLLVGVVAGVISANRTQRIELGQSVDSGSWKLVVHGIQNPDTHVTDSALGGFSANPAAGNHFVGANVVVTNDSGSVQNAAFGLLFELRDRLGHKYTPTHFGGTFGFGGGTPNGGLDSGKSLAGTIAFEVPDSARNLTLYFLPHWPLQTNAITIPVR